MVDIPCDDNAKPYFVGIISERDVLRLISPSVKTTSDQEIDKRALRQLLAQIVTRKPKTVSPDTPIAEVLTLLLDNHFDMLPVLDEADVVGIITTTDLLKIFLKLDKVVCQLSPDLNKTAYPGDANVLSLWTSQTVHDVMTKQVISLLPQDDLATAIDLMQEHKFRHIPIINEDGKLRGIVSDRDVLRQLHYAGKRPMGKESKFRDHLFRADPNFINLERPLIRMMTRTVTHVLPGMSVCDAAKILYELRLSCLPVLDEQKNLLGILTMTDLMSALLAIYGNKAEEE
jgi:CBS domain-containing protein